MEPQTAPEPTGKKIMIIEDESFIAEIYSRELTKAGFTVKTAGDGVSGLEELDKDEFDLLLLDILLPNMHGLEVLKQWKAKHPRSSMKVILLTNLGQDDVIQQAFKLGANGYLIKASYTPKQVVTEVVNILNGGIAKGTPQTPAPTAQSPNSQVQSDPTAPIIIDQPITSPPPVQPSAENTSPNISTDPTKKDPQTN